MKQVKECLGRWSRKYKVCCNSHLLGFGEGYGDGLGLPSQLTYGHGKLGMCVEEIYRGFHLPEPGKISKKCLKWRDPLTVISVMACEAAKFHPLTWYLEQLSYWDEQKLLDWFSDLFNMWSRLSKVSTRELTHVPYKDGIPLGYENLTSEMVRDLSNDQTLATLVLAILCRDKKDGKGKMSNKFPPSSFKKKVTLFVYA